MFCAAEVLKPQTPPTFISPILLLRADPSLKLAGDVEALRKHQLLARLLLSHKFQDQGLKTTQPDNAAAETLR